MINNVVLTGRLTKTPELIVTNSGKNLCNFNLAVNRMSKSDNGPDADFFNIIVFNKQAENVVNYLDKGSLIGIEGRLQSRSYDNKNGQKVFVVEVIARNVQFLDSKPKEGGQGTNTQRNQNNAAAGRYGPPVGNERYNQQPNQQQGQKPMEENPFNNAGAYDDIDDSDLPF